MPPSLEAEATDEVEHAVMKPGVGICNGDKQFATLQARAREEGPTLGSF